MDKTGGLRVVKGLLIQLQGILALGIALVCWLLVDFVVSTVFWPSIVDFVCVCQKVSREKKGREQIREHLTTR